MVALRLGGRLPLSQFEGSYPCSLWQKRPLNRLLAFRGTSFWLAVTASFELAQQHGAVRRRGQNW
jgi:hypothetical protein